MRIININNKYDFIKENPLFKKGGRVVVTEVAYPAVAAAGLCGEGGAVPERGVGGAVL